MPKVRGGRIESAPPRPDDPIRGIVFMVFASALLTVNDGAMKWLSDDYPVGELLFLRSLFVFPSITVLAWRAGGLRALAVRDYRGQAARAALGAMSSLLFIIALTLLPLADATAVSFAGPLIITALAAPLLGERVGWRRWCAVAIGFAGVMAMLRPGGDSLRWAVFVPLFGISAGAMRDIVTRRISAFETTISILCWSTTAIMLTGLASLPLGWKGVSPPDLALLAVAGLFQGAARFLQIECYRLARAVVVAPFKYSAMIWAVMIGFLIWGDLPDPWTVVGTALVVGCGLYVLRRESRLRAMARTAST